MTKTIGVCALTSLLVVSTVAFGDSYDQRYEYAHVTDVQPIIKRVSRPVSHRECWDEDVSRSRAEAGATGMIIGGIVGGVLGNQFGKGHGKQAATVAGALLGGSIGHDVSNRQPRVYHTTEQRCRVYDDYEEEEYVSGYRVTYQYGDRTYTRVMARDPGERLGVRVTVTPVE